MSYPTAPLAYNADVSNPKALNASLPADILAQPKSTRDGDLVFTRAPQVGHFRVWRDAIGTSVFQDLYAISNHFSSTPDGRVAQRHEQAAYDAAIVAALGNARIVVGGDLNVYPRPDDPFPTPSDQLGPLYSAGLTNVYDSILADAPSAAYSYIYEGQTQTLDQLFLNPQALGDHVQSRYAHVNADFPADFDGDTARGLSDHDPLLSRFYAVTPSALDTLMTSLGTAIDARAATQLRHHLEQAAKALDAGDLATYDDQLTAFANQARGLSPKFVGAEAAALLASEALLGLR